MQWLLCQYMYSWGKTDVRAIGLCRAAYLQIYWVICYQNILQILMIPKIPVHVSNYAADNEDMCPLVK